MSIKTDLFTVLAIMSGLALVILSLLPGCAGSASDRDFRSKVKSVELTGTGGSSRDGFVTAGAGAKFEFRDPSK